MSGGRFTPGATPSSAAPKPALPITTDMGQIGDTRRHVDVTIPRTSVRGKMRLITRREHSEIRRDTRRYLESEGFPVDATGHGAFGASDEWWAELAARKLQKAIRAPQDVRLELGTVEDWRECDDDQLGALLEQYDDLAAELDPIGMKVLSDEELHSIESAAKKSDATLLTSYGSRRLALYAITLASRLATSQTPT